MRLWEKQQTTTDSLQEAWLGRKVETVLRSDDPGSILVDVQARAMSSPM